MEFASERLLDRLVLALAKALHGDDNQLAVFAQ